MVQVTTTIEIQQILDHLEIDFSSLSSSTVDSLLEENETELAIPAGNLIFYFSYEKKSGFQLHAI
jgi:hypothetical protein